MPTGFVKSMIQASGLVRRTRSAMSRTTGTVRRALARPCGAGGLLAHAAAVEGPGLVLFAGRLAAHAELEEDRARAVHRPIEVGRGGDAAGVVLAGEDAAGQPADQGQAVFRRVHQDQLLDGQGVPEAGEAVHEFGGVGRTSADHGEFHARPTLYSGERDTLYKRLLGEEEHEGHGAMTSTAAAMVRFQSVWWAPLNDSRP